MKTTRKILGLVLTLCMLVSVVSVGIVPVAADTTYETYAQSTIDGSAVLHCFNWSYNNIKAALPDIAKAGYTAVQTSPVQRPKDYSSSYTDTANQWWKMYQPLGLSIAANGTTWLGTKAELTSLCTEADKYGIKVVVDIVANHLANNGTDGGTYSYLNSAVESDLKNSSYYHTNNTRVNDDSRYNITQYHLGMPDLNTQNSYVQQKALGLLKECIDCGVDGFRFDAAKHIELPTDDSSFKSDFWPTVINGAKAYTDNDLFFYGEILGNAGPNFGVSNYTGYMAITDNYTGDRALDKAYYKYAPELADSTYYKGASPSDSVLWVESHDTYMGSAGSAGFSNTSGISDDNIIKAWAIVGSRANSTALFFARPNSTMGAASSDTTWKSTAVAEVNKFKNHFDGTSEYLAYSGTNVAYNERGTKGVVISKLDGSGSVSLTAHRMEDGSYKDRITGNTFTVSNGTISGTVGSTGVAVVYNAEEAAGNFITASTLYLKPNSNWTKDNARFAMYVYNDSGNAWVSMTDADGDGTYEAAVPSGNWTNVIFCRMNGSTTENDWSNKWNQTDNLFPDNGTNCYTVADGAWDGGGGTWSLYSSSSTSTPTSTPTTASDTITVYATDDASWGTVYLYYWDNGANWPGTAMTYDSAAGVYSATIPKDVKGVVLNNNNNNKQTVNIITDDIYDGVHWKILNEQDNGKYKYSVVTEESTEAPTDAPTETPTETPTTPSASVTEQKVYLKPGEWTTANARLAVWVSGWKNYTSKWVEMESIGNGIYAADVSDTTVWASCKFARFDPNTTGFDSPWNTSAETGFVNNGLYTINSGEWDGAQGTWTNDFDPDATEPAETITVSATNTLGWDDVYLYYWGVSGSPAWPGTKMTAASGNVYTLTIPSGAIGVVLNNGNNGQQTANITGDDIYNGASWVISPVKDNENHYKVNLNFYLIGDMNSWKTGDTDYTFAVHESSGGAVEYKLSNVTLNNAAGIKVWGSDNTWYPDGENYQVPATGTYDIYFRPNKDGNDDWYEKYFYLKNVTPCTVTWKDGDGNTLKTETVTYGDMPSYTGNTPTKTATAQYTYTFNNTWSPAVAAVTGNTTYTAQFDSTVNKYTVTFKNEDGTVLQSSEVEYGATPTYSGATPAKAADAEHNYVFAGWSPDVTSVTGNATYTAQYTAIERRYFAGNSLTLGGDIGLNFYIDLRGQSAENATVTLSWYKYSVTCSLNEITPDGNGLYRVTCNVAAKEMNDKVTAELKIGDEVVAVDEYSVADYCYRIIENKDGMFNHLEKLDELQELVKSMLYYGARAQLQFAYNTDNLADSKLGDYTPGAVDDALLITHTYAEDTFSAYGLKYEGTSLLLKDTTTLRMYFTKTDGFDGTAVTYKGQTLTAGEKNGYVCYDIKGIKAKDILTEQTLTFAKGGDSAETAFNVSDYINAVKDDTTALGDVVRALYNYNRKAVAYF